MPALKVSSDQRAELRSQAHALKPVVLVGADGLTDAVLDEIKVSLLDGGVSAQDLDRLRRVVRDERERTDDPSLEAVLNEIEVRAAVEVAKLEQANHAA